MPSPDFARVFDEAPAPFLLLTPDFTIVHANRARLQATATTLEATVGRHLFDVFPMNPDDPAADGLRNLSQSLAQARDTKQPVTMPIQRYDIPMPDGTYEERFWSPRNVPILDEKGDVVLLLHRSDDITDYLRDRDDARREAARSQQWRERVEQAETDLFARTRELEALNAQLRAANERERRSALRLAGLALTASALAGAETLGDLLARLFEHCAPALDVEAVVVALRQHDCLRLAMTDSSGERPYRDGEAVPLDSTMPVGVAARGVPVLVHERAEMLERYGAEAERLSPAPELEAWAVLPLRVGDELLGSLALGWKEPQAFDEDDVRLLYAFTAQCAQAVDRVMRLEAERDRASATRTLAEALQRSLLTEPPQPDHLEIAVRYLPASEQAQVGGDWYDAFLSPDGATTLAIGDVTGHDRTAAAAMGQLRNLLRGVAFALDRGPAELLATLDAALRQLRIGTLATAVLARVEQTFEERAAGLRTLRWSNAGHPPPLLVAPDGTAQLLERPADLLLGLAPDIPRADHSAVLTPGSTVVLYTDGLVERRGEELDEGLARLAMTAARLHALPLEQLCDRLLAELAGGADDDIALVALRAHPEDRPRPAGL
nr:SpoIIE family protein phosphatase [Motilibacter aurantiacus]